MRNSLGQFVKNGIPWNKGTKGVMKPNSGSIKKGEHLSLKTEFQKGEMSEIQKGENNSYWKGGLPNCEICGKELNDYRSKICRSCMQKGNHPNWMGGKSFEPYGVEFNDKLKGQIRERDSFTCQECGQTEKLLGYKLDIHHIDFDKQNNNPSNLLSLCRSCHRKTYFHRKRWIEYFIIKSTNLCLLKL